VQRLAPGRLTEAATGLVRPTTSNIYAGTDHRSQLLVAKGKENFVPFMKCYLKPKPAQRAAIVQNPNLRQA